MSLSTLADTSAEPTDFWWTRTLREAEAAVRAEPMIAPLAISTLLGQPSLDAAVTQRLAARLDGEVAADMLRTIFRQVVDTHPDLKRLWRLDLAAVLDRDPAAAGAMDAILHLKGFHALQTHRIAHALWHEGRRTLARHLQDKASEVFQVDIHPAARIGAGVFIDHGTGIVIGETATIGDNVSLLQGVLLGAGDEDASGRRHPAIASGVMIGAGAKLFGPIEIGKCSRIGAGTIVLQSVPANTTFAGNPARIVGHAGCAEPSRAMDQMVFDVGL